MSIEIRLLKETEYKAANDFYNNTSHISRGAPLVARTYQEFSWEFINCPNGKAIYASAWETESGKEPVLVGVQCVLLLTMINEAGKHILSAKGEATLIDIKVMIKYKERDILKELIQILIQECNKKGVAFLWGFNTIPATYKRLGFESPFKSNYGIFILNPIKAYKNIIASKLTNKTIDKFKIALRSGGAYVYSMKRLTVFFRKQNYHFNTELEENEVLFKNAAFPNKMIFLEQNKAYLKWKTSENPYPITYKSFQLVNEDKLLVAQLICSLQGETAFIEQALFDRKITKRNRQAFINHILRILKRKNVYLVRYSGFDSNELNASEMNLLKSIGFVFTGRGEWFSFKNLSTDAIINPKKIYLSRMYKQGVN